MRALVTALIISAVTVFCGVLMNVQLANISKRLEAIETETISLLIEGDTMSAAEKTDEISRYIQKKRTFLASAVDHKCIDDIEFCIAELRTLCMHGEISSAIVKCGGFAVLIERLDANYSLSLKNIL